MSDGQGARCALGAVRSCLAFAVAAAATVSLPVQALEVFAFPAGQNLTLGASSSPRTVQTASSSFIGSLNDQAFVKLFVNAQPPLLPMGVTLALTPPAAEAP